MNVSVIQNGTCFQDLQENAVDKPDVVLSPSEPQVKAARGSNQGKEPRNPQEPNVCNGVDNGMFNTIAARTVGVLEGLTGLDFGIGPGNNKKAGKQDPCESGSHYVVHTWYLIEV